MKKRFETSLRIVDEVTCGGCGCVCDDISLTIRDASIERAEHACELGQTWFLQPRVADPPACLIDGKEASIDSGIARSAQILRSARYPLVCGLRHMATETQAVALSIADWIGGCLAISGKSAPTPVGLTLPGTADVTATLGEIRNRADLVVFWGLNPVVSHPRHLDRYSLNPAGLFVPRGRADRTCVVIDVRRSETAEHADVFLKIKSGTDFEAIWTLRALADGIELEKNDVRQLTGVALRSWSQLMQQMKSARYGVVFHGPGLTDRGTPSASRDALFALIRELNRFCRFVGIGYQGSGNAAGASEITISRTGYPPPVNFARGYPRFDPVEYTAEHLLAHGEADAALILGWEMVGELSRDARQHLQNIPTIVIDGQGSQIKRPGSVVFHVARYDIHGSGTVYRMDQVPIPHRQVLTSCLATDRMILLGIDALLHS